MKLLVKAPAGLIGFNVAPKLINNAILWWSWIHHWTLINLNIKFRYGTLKELGILEDKKVAEKIKALWLANKSQYFLDLYEWSGRSEQWLKLFGIENLT